MRASCPDVVAEIDGLALLMDAVRAGLGATIQPGAATRAASRRDGVHRSRIADAHAPAGATCWSSLSDDELSPAALAARVVMADVARTLVREGRWRRRDPSRKLNTPCPGACLPARHGFPTVLLHAETETIRWSMFW